MECLICFEPTASPYKITCGAKVSHEICHSCETTLRLQAKPTRNGRIIKCPVCRKDTTKHGNRTRASYEAELRMLYRELYPRILPFQVPASVPASVHPARILPFQVYQVARILPASASSPPVQASASSPPVQASPPPPPPVQASASSPPIQSSPSRDWCNNRTLLCPKSKTTRKCTYPMGCEKKVCRHCKMCISHFEF